MTERKDSEKDFGKEFEGTATITAWIDKRQVLQKVEVFSGGRVMSRIVASIPIEVGLLGGSGQIEVEVVFDPPVSPME